MRFPCNDEAIEVLLLAVMHFPHKSPTVVGRTKRKGSADWKLFIASAADHKASFFMNFQVIALCAQNCSRFLLRGVVSVADYAGQDDLF